MYKKRSLVVIDGSNFYFKLRDFNLHRSHYEFKFDDFVKSICEPSESIQSIYYVGKVRTDGTKKTAELHSKQRKLIANLVKCNIQYELGFLLKSGGKMHEKGVDVNMAVDILVATYEDICDHIVVVSSDTDLIPAIKKAKEKGKTVEYIGFKHMPSKAMIANCSIHKLLTKEDIKKFITVPSSSHKSAGKLQKAKQEVKA